MKKMSFTLFLVLISLCLGHIMAQHEDENLNAPIECDYLILGTTYEFSIENCTFAPDQKGNYFYEIFYKTENDGAGAIANQIRYVILDKNFNKNQTIQKLPEVNHHKGEIIEGKYFLTENLVDEDSAFMVYLENRDDWKIVITMDSKPKTSSNNLRKNKAIRENEI